MLTAKYENNTVITKQPKFKKPILNFNQCLINKVNEITSMDINKLKIYKEKDGYIIREMEGNYDGLKLIYDKDNNKFIISILDCLNSSIISEDITFLSGKIILIEKLDRELGLKLVNWDAL